MEKATLIALSTLLVLLAYIPIPSYSQEMDEEVVTFFFQGTVNVDGLLLHISGGGFFDLSANIIDAKGFVIAKDEEGNVVYSSPWKATELSQGLGLGPTVARFLTDVNIEGKTLWIHHVTLAPPAGPCNGKVLPLANLHVVLGEFKPPENLGGCGDAFVIFMRGMMNMGDMMDMELSKKVEEISSQLMNLQDSISELADRVSDVESSIMEVEDVGMGIEQVMSSIEDLRNQQQLTMAIGIVGGALLGGILGFVAGRKR